MSSVDDLVGALFPGEKLPPPTTSGTTTAANQSYESQLEKIQEQNRRQLGQYQQQQQKALNNSFDDSEDENSPRRQAAATAMTNNNTINNSISTSSVPKTNNIASTIPKPTTTVTMSTRPSAIWPTLPKNLLRACDEGTVILTNNVPQRDIQTHQRVLFPTSSSSPSTPTTVMTQDEIMEQRDASIVGGLAGEVQYCSYIRCKKCGHPVVRLQNAYVKAPQNKKKGSSTTSPSQPQESHQTQQTDDQKKKKEKSASSGGGHNFDDSSDDDNDQQHQAQPVTSSSSSGAAGGLLDEMYMLCRNHYPDFLALERTGQLKRKYDCALYWCQCTLASVCFSEHRRVEMKMNPVAAAVVSSLSGTNTSNNENGKLLDVSEEVVASKLDGEAPYSMRDISWECTGHHKPLM